MSKVLEMSPQGVATGVLGCQVPNTTAGDFTVARASVASRTTQGGTIEQVGNDIARIEFIQGETCPILLTEPQRTNLYLNSVSLSTQNITTIASDYTVSFYGTGTITFSGTFVGSLVGTGALDRVSVTFTASSGSLTSTVSGIVSNAQSELGDYATSYRLTIGAIATRLKDKITDAGNSTLINSEEGVLFVEFAALFDDGTFRAIALSAGTSSNRISIYNSASAGNLLFQYIIGGSSEVNTSMSAVQTDFNKIAVVWSSGNYKAYLNGVKIIDVSITNFAASVLDRLTFDRGDGANEFFGKTKSVKEYDSILTDAQLIALTS